MGHTVIGRGRAGETDSLMTLTGVDISPTSLGCSVFCESVAATAHAKLVSAVLRGERVRVEDWVVEGAAVEIMVRPPDSTVLPSLSLQVKA